MIFLNLYLGDFRIDDPFIEFPCRKPIILIILLFKYLFSLIKII